MLLEFASRLLGYGMFQDPRQEVCVALLLYVGILFCDLVFIAGASHVEVSVQVSDHLVPRKSSVHSLYALGLGGLVC